MRKRCGRREPRERRRGGLGLGLRGQDLRLQQQRRQPGSHEGGEGQGSSAAKPLSYPELLRLPGAAAVIGSFGCYSALESSMGLWIASHLVLARGIGEAQAASMVALFYLGVTCKNDAAALSAAIALVGLGCAPIYPSIVALTPSRFGEAASQGMVSLQMACAYVGSAFFPPVCALVAGAGAAGALPWLYVAVLDGRRASPPEDEGRTSKRQKRRLRT